MCDDEDDTVLIPIDDMIKYGFATFFIEFFAREKWRPRACFRVYSVETSAKAMEWVKSIAVPRYGVDNVRVYVRVLDPKTQPLVNLFMNRPDDW